jgi:hypothetical protein
VNFEEARAEYGRLRQAYDQRQLSAEEYGRRVQGLQVRDAAGSYWAIDGNTGGWLRYDGNAWVPGQPPVPPGPPPNQFGQPSSQGGFGGAPQGGFGQQPQGGFTGQGQGGFGGSPQGNVGQPQGGFGAQPQGNFGGVQSVATPAAPARRSRRGLIIGCSAAAVLLLICGVVGSIYAYQNLIVSGLTDVATTTSLNASNRPEREVADFTVNQPMFITYTAQNVKQGDAIELRLFRNGTRETLTGGEKTFDQDATFHGAFSYTPTAAGSYRGEFYLKGESTPSRTIEFTVR